ncbi:MAG: hypothetical protein IMZ53_15970 [Thermoplasmata archaeon]|nr:hypothetical protein [Thermoplasmata archaeon]
MCTNEAEEDGEKYWNDQAMVGAVAAANIPQVEIWRDESNAFYAMINAICTQENLRTWSEIADRWLKANHLLVTDDPAWRTNHGQNT